MALQEDSNIAILDDLKKIVRLLWGPNVQNETFRRWSQGFVFSPDEPTALIQFEGGPCAVIAPVQAFILKNIIAGSECDKWREADFEEQNRLLIEASCEILNQAHIESRYCLVCAETAADSVDVVAEPMHSQFHSNLKISVFSNLDEVKDYLKNNIGTFREKFGVLQFLYSVMCSRGLSMIEKEMCGTEEPLIDQSHGYGSQVLINLLITGNAVPHLFNDSKDVGGLTMYGIPQQSTVGFLTLLEHLRYCEVESYLKKPRMPVWVLGSETHLTVLFSFDRRLASPESRADMAKRIFCRFDPDGNNFISADKLGSLLETLELVSEDEYVNIIKDKLDSERLGIILLSSFLEEFFPEPDFPEHPDVFVLLHYNGQPQSNQDLKVVYREGTAVLLESVIYCILEDDALMTCLQTKWPTIDVQWNDKVAPSLN